MRPCARGPQPSPMNAGSPSPRLLRRVTSCERRVMSDAHRIHGLLSDPSTARSAEVRRALGAFPLEALLDELSSSDPWWMRVAVVPALAPKLDAAGARALLERARDPREIEEIRCACVDALADADRVEVRAALVELGDALQRDAQRTWRLRETATCAAVRLGATERAPAAAALRCDPWRHRSALGEAGLRGLIARVGLDGVARALGGVDATDSGLSALALTHPDAPTRRWAVDVARAESPWLVDALRDAAFIVAEGALRRLATRDGTAAIDARLDALSLDETVAIVVRARAMLALWRRGHEELAAHNWNATPDAGVLLPEVPDDVRRAVLAAYLPGEAGTDPQWILEGLIELGLDLDVARETGLDEAPDAIVDAARAALVDAGFIVGEAVPIGQVRQQGGGTYREVRVDGAVLQVCELGRFVASEEGLSSGVRTALEAQRFRVIEGALAQTVFEGLRVYYFGHRDPRTVAELLFYWQD